jgi:HlyD family secretion protein
LNEIDIVNVKLGQPVELTFDAIPGEVFMGSIAQIDTIGVNTSNVVSFLTKISIPDADQRIKSGMSVTANIITEKVEGVLSVPSGTIKSEGRRDDKKTYVLKKVGSGNNSTTTKSYVTVGMTNDIDTEILEGLNEGDEVLSKTFGATIAKTQNTFSLFGGGGGGARPAGAGGARPQGGGGGR